ncbi:hypothetical protein Tco_0628451 [Tanacetum coccineum]|uniref:Uncharacterized protein n=1 Tax=Tanacetum coccineum TaxID=301880 RepID=A0ABQ4WQC2_9ASTR
MDLTLSGSQGLSSPQANGYVVKAIQIRLWLSCFDADFLVADSTYLKIGFGDGCQDVAVQSSGAFNARSI